MSPDAPDLDLFFGPRVFKNSLEVMGLFMNRLDFPVTLADVPQEYLDVDQLANAQYFPVVLALKKGLKVKGVEIPFTYPLLQKQNEEMGARDFFVKKREYQRVGLLKQLELLVERI